MIDTGCNHGLWYPLLLLGVGGSPAGDKGKQGQLGVCSPVPSLEGHPLTEGAHCSLQGSFSA